MKHSFFLARSALVSPSFHCRLAYFTPRLSRAIDHVKMYDGCRLISQMADVPTAIASEKLVASFPGQVQMRAPLAQASTTTLVRSLLLGKCFASPTLFPMCMKLMKVIINSNSALLSPDRNIFLRALVRGLIYNHFCAGVTPQEVKEKVASIKAQGYAGVILGFSREIVVDDHEDGLMSEDTQRNSNDKCIGEWLHANLDTLKLIGTGDYMNIK